MTNDARVDGLQQRLDALSEKVDQKFDFLIDQLQLLSESILKLSGACPKCGRIVKDWKAPTGSFAPEEWATLREKGIDPATGHKAGCSEVKPSRRY